jgi:hypothetical protein
LNKPAPRPLSGADAGAVAIAAATVAAAALLVLVLVPLLPEAVLLPLPPPPFVCLAVTVAVGAVEVGAVEVGAVEGGAVEGGAVAGGAPAHELGRAAPRALELYGRAESDTGSGTLRAAPAAPMEALPEAASAWRIAGATLLVLMGALSSADSLICWSSVAISLARNRCVGSASHASSGFALPPLAAQSVCSPWPPFSGMLALESARLRSCVGAGCMGCMGCGCSFSRSAGSTTGERVPKGSAGSLARTVATGPSVEIRRRPVTSPSPLRANSDLEPSFAGSTCSIAILALRQPLSGAELLRKTSLVACPLI